MEETEKEKKVNYKRHTVNIEIDLYEKIEQLQKSTYSKLGITKIINIALDSFFNGKDAGSDYMEFLKGAKNDILVPYDKYASLFSLSVNTIKNKINSGNLEKVMIGNLSYIRLRDEDMRNSFTRVVMQEEEIRKMKVEIQEMKSDIAEIRKYKKDEIA